MKRLIKLTESDIRNIIKETYEKILKGSLYYHGGDLNDDMWHNGLLWLTPQDYYAKEYAKENNEPIIYKIYIDESKLKAASIYKIEEIIGDEFDPYQGLNHEQIKEVLDNDYNCYYMDYDSYNAEGLALLTKDPILNIERMTEEEYNNIEIFE